MPGAVFSQEWLTSFHAELNNGGYLTTTSWTCSRNALTSRFISTRTCSFPMDISFHPTPVDLWFGGYSAGSLSESRVQGNYRASARFSIGASGMWDIFRLSLPNANFSVVLASL